MLSDLKTAFTCTPALRPVHTRELAPAARSCNTLPEKSALVCTNDFQLKNMLRNKTFAPELCFPVCTKICLPWNDVSPIGQSNWLIFFHPTSSHAPIGLFRHSAPSWWLWKGWDWAHVLPFTCLAHVFLFTKHNSLQTVFTMQVSLRYFTYITILTLQCRLLIQKIKLLNYLKYRLLTLLHLRYLLNIQLLTITYTIYVNFEVGGVLLN